jgi:hypothetical protein
MDLSGREQDPVKGCENSNAPTDSVRDGKNLY